MIGAMSGRLPAVATANMAEVQFLLERGNRIIDVGLEPTLAGSSVFMVRLEGEKAESDHSDYLSFPTCNSVSLPRAFRAVCEAIERKEKRRSETGGAL